VSFERVGIEDGDAVVAIHGDVVVLLEAGHHLVNALARGADEAGDITLSQADRDGDGAVGAGLAAWIVSLQRRLQAARMRGDMYRDISARLDRQVVELSGRGH